MKFRGLLWETLKVQTHSGQCEEMQQHVVKYLEKFGIPEVTMDTNGNIIATKGKAEYYPTFVAHMDTVHSIVPRRKWKPSWKGDKITAPTGIGGDDKVGVAAALWLMKNVPVGKAIFTVDEEIGAIGAENLDMSYLNDVGYMLQTDRRGNNDLITDYMGTTTANEEFLDIVIDAGKRFGFEEESGVFTDVMILGPKGQISAINISSGYHNPHSSMEYVLVSEATNTLNYMFSLYKLLETGKRYTHEWPERHHYPIRTSYYDRDWAYKGDYDYTGYVKSKPKDIRSLIESLYDSTHNAVYEWALYFSQVGDDVLEAMWQDSRCRGGGFKTYLIERFGVQIENDLYLAGYTDTEIGIHMMSRQYTNPDIEVEEVYAI